MDQALLDIQQFLGNLFGINLHSFLRNLFGENVCNYIEALFGSGVEGNWFYYLGPVSAILLCAFWKKERKTFALPMLIMMILIMNPITKTLFEKVTGLEYYWRLLWIIPIIAVCAALPGMISEKIKNEHLKALVAIPFAILFILTGSYTYDQRLARFFIPANEEKIEQRFVDVADTLLTYDDHPYVVADAWPSVFLRQYSPKIRLLYGRNILGFGISSEYEHQVERYLGEGDYSSVASVMLKDGYEYLVTDDTFEGKPEGLEKAGFEFLTRIDIYGIYRIQGQSTATKKTNEPVRNTPTQHVSANSAMIYNTTDKYSVFREE